MQMPMRLTVIVIVIVTMIMVMAIMAIMAGFHLEEAYARRAFADFIECGFADAINLDAQAQRHTSQRVVAIEDDVVGVNIGHVKQHVFRCSRVAARRQAFKEHAFFQLLWEFVARGDVNQLIDVVAKSVLRLQMQLDDFIDDFANQVFVDFGEQIVAANEEFSGLIEHIQLLAERVFHHPSEGDDALRFDVMKFGIVGHD